MASSLDVLAVRRRLGRGTWSAPVRFGPDGWLLERLDGRARVIVTAAPYGGDEWVHASIAGPEMPAYDDLKRLHAAVFGCGWAYQVFAPPAEHVNLHERALHLFGRLDGKPALPDFTCGTGSI